MAGICSSFACGKDKGAGRDMIEFVFLFLLYGALEVCNKVFPSYYSIISLVIRLAFHVAEQFKGIYGTCEDSFEYTRQLQHTMIYNNMHSLFLWRRPLKGTLRNVAAYIAEET